MPGTACSRVPESLAETLKIRAVREHCTVQDLITEAVEALLKTPLRRRKEGEK